MSRKGILYFRGLQNGRCLAQWRTKIKMSLCYWKVAEFWCLQWSHWDYLDVWRLCGYVRRPCAYTCWEDSFAKGTSKGLGDSRDTPAIEVSWTFITGFAVEINKIEWSLTHIFTKHTGKEMSPFQKDGCILPASMLSRTLECPLYCSFE